MSECHQCQTTFVKVKPWQRFCSSKCKYRHQGQKDSSKEYSKQYSKSYKHTKVHKYNVHKHGAKRRGIDFLLTFNEWCCLWEEHWDSRGKGKDNFVMCRKGDEGPYSTSNVYIDTYSSNCKDAALKQNQTRDSSGRFISDNT